MQSRESGKILTAILLFGVLAAAAAFLFTMDPFHLVHEEDNAAGSPFGEKGDSLSLAAGVAGGRGDGASIIAEVGEGASPDSGDRFEKVLETYLTARVKGRVEDCAGEPVSGARVAVESTLPAPFGGIIPGGRYKGEVATDGDGAFHVSIPEDGAFGMTVEKEGFAPFRANLVLPGDDLTVVLSEGACLGGTVRDKETGGALAGASLYAHHLFQTFETQADEAGAFLFRDLPEGIFSLDVFEERHDLWHLDGVLVSRKGSKPLDIALDPGGPLKGRVLELGTGRPVTGATVTYRIMGKGSKGRKEVYRQDAAADGKGEFSFDCVSRKGFRVEAAAGGYSPGVPEPLEGKASDPAFRLDIYLQKESAVSGRVVDPEGRPVKGARLKVLGQRVAAGGTRDVVTDGAGAFEVAGLEGGTPFALMALSDTLGTGVLDKLMVSPGQTLSGLEVRIQRPAAITGVVTGPDGEPCPDARVSLDGIRGYLVRYGGAAPLAMTDGEGRFRFKGLISGEYRLAASHRNLRSDVVDLFLQEGEEYEADLAVADGLSLAGVVTDPSGEPVDDVLVTAVAFNSEALSGGSTPGRVAPRNGPMGNQPRKLSMKGGSAKPPKNRASGKPSKSSKPSKFSKPQRNRGAGKVSKDNRGGGNSASSSAAGRNSPSRTELLEEKVRRFLLYRSEGATPAEFDLLRRLGYCRFRGNARTGETGRFTLTGLKPDDVLLLSFRRYGYLPQVLTDVLPGGGDVSAVLAPQVSLSGRVVDYATNAPVYRFRVEWISTGGDPRSTSEILGKGNSFRKRGRAFQSEDGTFLIENLAPGEIIMHVTAKGYRPSEPRRFIVSSRYPPPFQVFTILRGGSVRGRLTASDGSPVTEIPVMLSRVIEKKLGASSSASKGSGKGRSAKGRKGGKRGGRRSSAPRGPSQRTDGKGRFFFSNVKEGAYRILVGDPSHPAVDPVTVKLGKGKNASRTITLRDLGGLEVRVSHEDSLAARSMVELTGGAARVVKKRFTGSLGIASFKNLFPGRYRLKIFARGYKPHSETLTVEKGKRVEKEVSLAARK